MKKPSRGVDRLGAKDLAKSRIIKMMMMMMTTVMMMMMMMTMMMIR